MLQEAESFAGRCQGGAESWAEQMEVLLTEELDGRLRAHRPRAGKLEEEVSREGSQHSRSCGEGELCHSTYSVALEPPE